MQMLIKYAVVKVQSARVSLIQDIVLIAAIRCFFFNWPADGVRFLKAL